MQRRSERCSGCLARGSNVRIQTRLCDPHGGDCIYVSRMQVSHQKYLLRIHIYVYDSESAIIRDFRILAALTRQRHVSGACMSRTGWVTRATVTSRRPSNARPPRARTSRFGLSNLSTRPIVPSIVHEWGKTIRTGCYSGEVGSTLLAHPVI